MCAHCCIAFREYMFAGKALLDYTNLFSPKIYLKNLIYSKKNDSIIYKYLKKNMSSIKFRVKEWMKHEIIS